MARNVPRHINTTITITISDICRSSIFSRWPRYIGFCILAHHDVIFLLFQYTTAVRVVPQPPLYLTFQNLQRSLRSWCLNNPLSPCHFSAPVPPMMSVHITIYNEIRFPVVSTAFSTTMTVQFKAIPPASIFISISFNKILFNLTLLLIFNNQSAFFRQDQIQFQTICFSFINNLPSFNKIMFNSQLTFSL